LVIPLEILGLSKLQKSTDITMILKRGAIVPIRLVDAAQSLAQNEGKTPGAHLLLGVSSDAFAFHTAPVISRDAAGRNHQIVIHYDRAVKLVVTSPFFRVTDSGGRELPRSGSAMIPITVPTGQQPAPVTLTVAGH
jgi:hypothetical protein